YTLLTYAHAALVTSGTASLETALFSVPEVICYKGGWLSYFIARMLIKIKFIGLANLIMDKGIVREMIQGDLTVKALERELDRLINDKGYRGQLQKDYADLKQLLGGSGSSERTAQLMFDRLNNSKS
nr:lipid-A-disaccharide synthase [Bacteroidales bacterium]